MAEKRGGFVPGSDAIRNAMRWLAERRGHDPAAPRSKLIEEAAARFDLSPIDVEFLMTSWREG